MFSGHPLMRKSTFAESEELMFLEQQPPPVFRCPVRLRPEVSEGVLLKRVLTTLPKSCSEPIFKHSQNVLNTG